MNLNQYLEDIKKVNVNNQRISFHQNHWENFKYKDQNQELKDTIIKISKDYGDGITRESIVNHLKAKDSLMEGFILTMMWGHGYTDESSADNRGPWKVNLMFDNYVQSNKILKAASKALSNNDIKSAHNAFDKMKRCRVNYFSKFLYFLGKSMNMAKYPLIFDARVTTSLFQLNSNDKDVSNLIDVYPKQDAKSYSNYVDLIHREAAKLKVEADKLELFLFEMQAKKDNQKGKATE